MGGEPSLGNVLVRRPAEAVLVASTGFNILPKWAKKRAPDDTSNGEVAELARKHQPPSCVDRTNRGKIVTITVS
jgi:hypothetical protein